MRVRWVMSRFKAVNPDIPIVPGTGHEECFGTLVGTVMNDGPVYAVISPDGSDRFATVKLDCVRRVR